jgi:hypothetical protein
MSNIGINGIMSSTEHLKMEGLQTVRRIRDDSRIWISLSFTKLSEAVLQIRDVYPGSDFIPSQIPGQKDPRIPDPGSGSASKNLSILTKNCFCALGHMIRDVHPGSGS